MTANVLCVLAAVLAWAFGPHLAAVTVAFLVLAGTVVLALLVLRRALAHGIRLHHSRLPAAPARPGAMA